MKSTFKQMKLIQPLKLIRTTNQFLQCTTSLKTKGDGPSECMYNKHLHFLHCIQPV